MLRQILFIITQSCMSTLVFGQQKSNPYHLPIQQSYAIYKQTIAKNPNAELVDIRQYVPKIHTDVKYASTNNFMKKIMYSQAKVYVRKIVAIQLAKVQEELIDKGLCIKIFDGYRPYAVTLDFYKNPTNRNFVAHPKFGSKHNRGCAVDLTIINLKTGQELDMGTPYDSFLKESAAWSTQISPEARQNRDFFIQLMRKYDLQVLRTEWWHFDYKNWKSYSLMDISFEELSAQK